MIQKYSRYKILQEFFNKPLKDHSMREVSRNTKITIPSTQNHLKELVKEGLILREKKGLYPTYRANREKQKFKSLKKSDILHKLQSTIEKISDSTPKTIVLFGSASKGEDTEKSDIDIFVQSKEKEIDLKKEEKILRRKINLLFEPDFKKLSPELKNNIINGIILYGYLEVF